MIKKFITTALLSSLSMPILGMKQIIKQNKKSILSYAQQLYNNLPITSDTVLIGAGTAGTIYLSYLCYHYSQEAEKHKKQRQHNMQNILQTLKKLKLPQESPHMLPAKSELKKQPNLVKSYSKPNLLALFNVGNSCYMNAMLQCLYALEPFRELLAPQHKEKTIFMHPFLIQLQYTFETFKNWNTLNQQQQKCILCTMYQWVQASINKLNLQLLTIKQEDIVQISCDWHCPQEDTSELFQKCIDFFDIEIFLTHKEIKNFSAFLQQRNKRTITSSLDTIFDVHQLEGIWCQGNAPNKDPTISHEIVIELPEEYSDKLSLYDLFENKQEIPQDAQLPHGVQRKDCVKKRALIATSEILVIKLLRFYENPLTGIKREIKNPITMPLQLDIKKFYLLDQNVHTNYELISFTNIGGIDSGHYIAYIKTDREWLECSDDNITPITSKEAKQAAARGYIFFYQRTTN